MIVFSFLAHLRSGCLEEDLAIALFAGVAPCLGVVGVTRMRAGE